MTNPDDIGVYVLLVRLGRSLSAGTGRRAWTLPAGWYAYVGRALNGLRGRLGRHLAVHEVRHWHVDHLLAAGRVVDVQVRFTTDPADECRTAVEVAAWPGAEPVPGFGCSDCGCPTHLLGFRQRPGGALLARDVTPDLPAVFGHLRQRYENHALWERDPFRCLVACILSLRTQDPVTDAAADRLFAELRSPQDFVGADPDRIARLIYPVGMYRQKAAALVRIAHEILTRLGGRVPAEIEALATLPGVGRKTANLVRSFAFHLPAVCVDTHVHRITNRWGLVRTATPDQTECELRHRLPGEYWIEINPLLVQHGQQVCRPTGPRCDRCPLAGLCRFADLQRERRLLADIPAAPPHPSLTL